MNRRTVPVLVLSLLASALPVRAVTWHVEKDGSGDWSTIQGAMDAAASGDTIRIGPGRYDDMHPSIWAMEAVATVPAVDKELVLIGAGIDLTIIGPEMAAHPDSLEQYGIVRWGNAPMIIRDMAFENLRIGFYLIAGPAWVFDCRTSECWAGGTVDFTYEGGISGTQFFGSSSREPSETLMLGGSMNLMIKDCLFDDASLFLHNEARVDTVRNCVFRGESRSANAQFISSSGVFESNEMSGGQLICLYESRVEVRDNVFNENTLDGRNLSVHGSSAEVVIDRNVFAGSAEAAICLSHYARISGQGNHIFNGPGEYAILLDGYTEGSTYSYELDLTGNYWGTASATAIDSLIRDAQDDPLLGGTVLFEPFATGPLETEPQSLGSFKSLFR